VVLILNCCRTWIDKTSNDYVDNDKIKLTGNFIIAYGAREGEIALITDKGSRFTNEIIGILKSKRDHSWPKDLNTAPFVGKYG